jgi:succinate-acetate transporter protein
MTITSRAGGAAIWALADANKETAEQGNKTLLGFRTFGYSSFLLSLINARWSLLT